MTVLIDGKRSDGRIEVTDSSVMRGDGCFEAIRVYSGVPFETQRHLARLERSAASLGFSLPPTEEIASWVEEVAVGLDLSLVRVLATRGSAIEPAAAIRVIVFSHPIEVPASPVTLLPVPAPWHAPSWELAGAKTLSYAPNLAARRTAISAGFDDALLISGDGDILEGPTFSIAWVCDGHLELPSLGLGILDSITRQLVADDALTTMDVVEGRWGLDRLDEASEVLVMSTVREVQPVAAVGALRFRSGPVTRWLSAAFGQRTVAMMSGQGSISAMPAHDTNR